MSYVDWPTQREILNYCECESCLLELTLEKTKRLTKEIMIWNLKTGWDAYVFWAQLNTKCTHFLCDLILNCALISCLLLFSLITVLSIFPQDHRNNINCLNSILLCLGMNKLVLLYSCLSKMNDYIKTSLHSISSEYFIQEVVDLFCNSLI